MLDLAGANEIEVLPWSNVDLWNLVKELTNDDRIDVLGIPPYFKDRPMQTLEEIHQGVQTLITSQEPKDNVAEPRS